MPAPPGLSFDYSRTWEATLRDLFLVGIGGLLGATSRFLTSRWLTAAYPVPGHIATLIINTAGSLFLGFIIARAAGSSQFARWQVFLTVGFCGSFTTFSTWILDISNLAQQASLRSATNHVLASLVLGVAAFALGMLAGQRWGLPLHLGDMVHSLRVRDWLAR